MKINNEQNKGIFNGVFLGYFVLLLHVILIVGLGVAVVLIKGIYDFRWFIFAAGTVLVVGSGYLFYRRLKESNRSLREAMNDPALRDRTLEISLFGGMASVKLGHTSDQPQLLDASPTNEIRQLEAPRSHVQELSELAKMLDENLITREEFERLKKEIVI
jgi:hypothetical protein